MLLVIASLAAGAEPVDLDPVLRFSAPAECGTAEPLSAIIAAMTRINPVTYEAEPPSPISVPGFAQPIEPRFERTRIVEGMRDERSVTVDLALPGRWHGLRVLRIRRTFVEEGDSSTVEVHFAETQQQVREVLNLAGFRLPRIGEWRSVWPEEQVVGLEVGVSPIEGGAAFVCSQG